MSLRVPVVQRIEARRLYWSGMNAVEVAATVGIHRHMVRKLMQDFPWPLRRRNPLRLSLAEREEISVGIKAGESLQRIASRLKRATSTVSREVAAQGSWRYRAWRGDERAERLAGRAKPSKLDRSPKLRKAVEDGLSLHWSPAQIAKRLQVDYPNDPDMRVSHETIYKALYVQGRGTLRKELKKCLRQAHPVRRRRSKVGRRGKIIGMVNISQRPSEVEGRAVPGHWEGDLIVGKEQHSAIGTLVERSTRFVMLLHLPNGKTAEHVRDALTRKIQTLPAVLRRSVTWDQGLELARHAQFTVDTGVKVYFCDPHSPWLNRPEFPGGSNR